MDLNLENIISNVIEVLFYTVLTIFQGLFNALREYIVIIGFLAIMYCVVNLVVKNCSEIDVRKKSVTYMLILYSPFLMYPFVSYGHFRFLCAESNGISTYGSIEVESKYFSNNSKVVSVGNMHVLDNRVIEVGGEKYLLNIDVSMENFGVHGNNISIYDSGSGKMLSEGVSYTYRSKSFPLNLSLNRWFGSEVCVKDEKLESGSLIHNMLYLLFLNKGLVK